jgi:hypothetical protein
MFKAFCNPFTCDSVGPAARILFPLKSLTILATVEVLPEPATP